MNAIDVIKNMGVTEEMIVRITGQIADMPHGYEIEKNDICTEKLKQVIHIYPKQLWSDGSIRPIYGYGGWDSEKYNVSIYLNTRI